MPDFMVKMNEKGMFGAKSGKGFYYKKKGQNGSTNYKLNPETFEYEDRKKMKTAATEMAKQQKGSKRKLKALVSAKGDKAGDLVWAITKPALIYSAELLGEIADDIISIDEAMRWGFGWEMGPFEMWDAIGLKESIERMQAEGDTVPDWVMTLIEDGHESFYKKDDLKGYYYDQRGYKEVPVNKKEINLKQLKEANGVIKKNAGASLIDLGDGVAGLRSEEHTSELQSRSHHVC